MLLDISKVTAAVNTRLQAYTRGFYIDLIDNQLFATKHTRQIYVHKKFIKLHRLRRRIPSGITYHKTTDPGTTVHKRNRNIRYLDIRSSQRRPNLADGCRYNTIKKRHKRNKRYRQNCYKNHQYPENYSFDFTQFFLLLFHITPHNGLTIFLTISSVM